MLNKFSKNVLKKLIQTDFVFEDIDSFAAQFPKMTVHQVESTLSYLHETGYIECIFADSTIYCIHSKYKGQHYFENHLKENMRFWIPIIVSNLIAVLALVVSILSYIKR